MSSLQITSKLLTEKRVFFSLLNMTRNHGLTTILFIFNLKLYKLCKLLHSWISKFISRLRVVSRNPKQSDMIWFDTLKDIIGFTILKHVRTYSLLSLQHKSASKFYRETAIEIINLNHSRSVEGLKYIFVNRTCH